jgi:hypothetical protein
MWWFIDMPAGIEERKFDGQTLGFFIEGSPATGDCIMHYPDHDPATR